MAAKGIYIIQYCTNVVQYSSLLYSTSQCTLAVVHCSLAGKGGIDGGETLVELLNGKLNI